MFSVLLALFVNRCAENQRTEDQKEVALQRIVQELKSNQEIIGHALSIHQAVLNNLEAAMRNGDDSLRLYLSIHRYADSDFFQYLVGGQGSFYPRTPSSTAWNAAKSTGIVTGFEYETVDVLTGAYEIQRAFKERTLLSITQVFFSPIEENELDTIMALYARTQELVSQEETALAYIKRALENIERSVRR